jgi:hypothetical protein
VSHWVALGAFGALLALAAGYELPSVTLDGEAVHRKIAFPLLNPKPWMIVANISLPPSKSLQIFGTGGGRKLSRIYWGMFA